jgi:hypothetical protein
MDSTQSIADKLAHCANYNGTSEKVTVAAGTFDTCKITLSNAETMQTSWYGNAAFGIIKSDAISKLNGATLHLELQEHKE